MKHHVVKQPKAKEALPVGHGCRVLGAGRSGYYAAQKRAEEPAKVCLPGALPKAVFAASGRSYGSRRLKAAPVGQGHKMGRHRARTRMRRHGLKPVWKRKFTATTHSKHLCPWVQPARL